MNKGREKSMVVDWSGLPSDLVAVISSRLSSCLDHVRFRSVCTTWRFAAPKRPRLPLLLLKHRHGSSYYSTLCNFSNTADTADHYSPSSRLQGQHLCGYSCGWLYFLNDTESRICLHNPFTGVHIRLPVLPFMSIPRKVVLSSSEPGQCVIMARCGNRVKLLFLQTDASWASAIFPPSFNSWHDDFEDAIFYQGKLYAVSTSGFLFVCPIGTAGLTEISPVSSNKPPRKRYLYQTNTSVGCTKSRLVVSSGDLFLARITFTNSRASEVSGCELFRFEFDCGQLRLSKLENLGGCAFFLSGHSMSLSVDEPFPTWCRANCIYYTDANIDHIVVYNMDDGSISLTTPPSMVKPPGVCYAKHWIKPSLC